MKTSDGASWQVVLVSFGGENVPNVGAIMESDVEMHVEGVLFECEDQGQAMRRAIEANEALTMCRVRHMAFDVRHSSQGRLDQGDILTPARTHKVPAKSR